MTYAHKVIVRVVIAAALALTGLVAVSTATPAQAAYSQTYLNGYERRVVDAINVERAKRGLRAELGRGPVRVPAEIDHVDADDVDVVAHRVRSWATGSK
jgi:hypothetical protein